MNDDKISDLVPEGYTPLEITYAVKCLDPEGHVDLFIGSTETLNPWERVGMLTAALDDARDDMRAPVYIDEVDED